MIEKSEIKERAEQFDIHPSNVERDYVFGWLLFSIFHGTDLGQQLVLKGGNCLRKGYFEKTRYSRDIDFGTASALDPAFLQSQLNQACDVVHEATGIVFEKDRNVVSQKKNADRDLQIYEARLYFKDFFGNPETITISIRLDITQFDRFYLPIQERNLIHPYSDSADCRVQIRCMKLEEVLAAKLKCLLQRRHLADLYDFVYSILINKDIEVDRSELVRTFLKKTIFERSPGVVRGLLLDLPLEAFRAVWSNYLICPRGSLFDFEFAWTNFRETISALFAEFSPGAFDQSLFFSSDLRNPIMAAGANLTVLDVVYQGRRRQVEPYSLVYKVRKGGLGREYLYVYDQTGGSSQPGIKSFVADGFSSIQTTETKFEPRFPVELSKAGEYGENTYFSRPFGGSVGTKHRRSSTKVQGSPGIMYVVECSYCGKKFRRKTPSTRVRPHKDPYGNDCYGRTGWIVDQVWTRGGRRQ